MDLKTSLIYLFVVPGIIFSLFLIVAESFLPAWMMLMIGCLVGILLYMAATSTLPTFSAKGATERPIAVETATTETTEPTERKRGIIPFLRRGGPGEFWVLGPIFLAFLACFIYLLIQILS